LKDRAGGCHHVPVQQLKTVRHARKVRAALGAYFPAYLFVRFDLTKDRWRSVNGTLGVSRLVGSENRPTAIERRRRQRESAA
jgi:transcription antitermination factor NusG